MPYIEKWKRDRLETYSDRTEKPGELNFMFTNEIIRYLNDKGLSYQTINDIIGALEGAKLEFYRRVAAPYEDQKIKQNGDVYPEKLSPSNQEIYDGIYGK